MSYTDEESSFRARVLAACGDLTAEQQAKVMEAVDTWLQERRPATGEGALVDLGDPGEYVAEIRAAMELPAAPARGEPAPFGRVRLWQWGAAVAVLLASTAVVDVVLSDGDSGGRNRAAGVGLVNVPSVLDANITAATRQLDRAGLHTKVEVVVASGHPPGLVIAQQPAADSQTRAGSVVTIRLSGTYRDSGTFPPCPAASSPPSASVHVVLDSMHSTLDRSCYHAPADTAFRLTVTTTAFTRGTHTGGPLRLQLMISPQSDPAERPVPGHPGLWAGSSADAAFICSLDTPATRSFTVTALPAGLYAIQLVPIPAEPATLVIT